MIVSQDETRLQWLVPVRHWRMAQSPFAFYRGAAKLMGQDLATTPASGITAQICGDAHLSNFVPFRELPKVAGQLEAGVLLEEEFSGYLHSMREYLAVSLERYEPVDGALKVVGVGSVGTRCSIILLQGRDATDPLFLQVKEAGRSVLEDHLPPSRYENHGRRVVEGQPLMQALSDSFLGWNRGDVTGTHYYWRQLKDMKGSPYVDSTTPESAHRFASPCGWTLARAHARSGDAAAIAGYLGSGEVFDRALGDFAVAYADQNERDFEAFTNAIDSGRIEAHEG